MALRLGFKINRLLKLSRAKFTNVEHIRAFSNPHTKSKCTNHPVKSASSLTPNQVERKLKNKNVEQISIQTLNETNQTPVKSNVEDIPIIPSDLQDSPVTLRRKFAMSSTQHALTQPLKLNRLATPFPEPVKTLRSDTVSDEEKARQMHEQVKMEARYHLQMHQEMLLQKKLQKHNNQVEQLEEPNQQINHQDQQTSQQPKFRKPKQYTELQEEPSSNNQEFQQPSTSQESNNSPKKFAINTTEKHAEDIKQKRPRNSRCRRKSHTRAARYLRHSWYPRGYIRRQTREYSTSVNSPTINPKIMSESEQCDLIIKRLKTLYPEYKNLKKPLLIPGSQEEKDFIKGILRLIGQLTDKSKQNRAPFPSYSEVKTFRNTNLTNEKITNKITFKPGSSARYYSTKRHRDGLNIIVQPKPGKICPKFKLKGYTPVECTHTKKEIPTKQVAPYPSYSEICDEPTEQESTNYKICSWKADVTSMLTKTHNKHYSTSSGDKKQIEKQVAKKKPPCKNPFPKIPECDYEKQAEKNAERKKKNRPKKKKTPTCKSVSAAESGKIIRKIKKWLNTYKHDKENIRITKSPDDIDGRESYVIEVSEYHEITPNDAEPDITISKEIVPEIVEIIQPEIIRSSTRRKPFQNMQYQPIDNLEGHVLEMIEPIPVQSRNIPDFVTSPSITATIKKQPEELKLSDGKETSKLKVKESKEKTVESKINKVRTDIGFMAKKESKINKVKENILTPKLELNVTENIKPTKVDGTNKYKEPVSTHKVNVVKEHLQFKPKNHKKTEIKNTINVLREPVKLPPPKDSILKSKDFKLINVKHNIYSKYKDFKVNDMKELPVSSFSSPPKCPKFEKGECDKPKPQEPQKKKCRFRKKRKLPSCDDVTKNKGKKCLSIPGLEDKPEYMINAPKKTYFKNTENISNFINIQAQDIGVLASQKPPTEENFVPFKLKPQFWKK